MIVINLPQDKKKLRRYIRTAARREVTCLRGQSVLGKVQTLSLVPPVGSVIRPAM